MLQKSLVPQVVLKLLFAVGSSHDPAGKEGLAALAAAMIADGGSRTMSTETIAAALHPIAGSFTRLADKEMTTFTGSIHRDAWETFLALTLPRLSDPGFREQDFARLKAAQLNDLVEDLRSSNEEELGRERLQERIFRGTPYGHVSLGTVAGLEAITLEDVRQFVRRHYTRANLTVGINGDAPPDMIAAVRGAVARLPDGARTARATVQAKPSPGITVEILEKDTRAIAISFGFPIDVTRAHPDFAALSVARAWLGEHRSSDGRLYQRIREARGMNYGDYAYIEAFPRGMFQFFAEPNVARQRQIFEVWIRPVVPAHAHMAVRIALHELRTLVARGLTADEFAATRDYLMKNVYAMTARQNEQLGYALDSQWYGIGEFTDYMRSALRRVTREQVNAAVRKHLGSDGVSMVIVTKDAAALKQALASDAPSTIQDQGARPQPLLDEDQVIGALELKIAAENIAITPIAEVFAR